MNERLNKKEAALWVNEAWGRADIKPKHVYHKGNWLFVNDPEDDYSGEVECIHAPKSGDIWAETFTGIKLEDSPFVEKDKAKLAKTLEKLDAQIHAHLVDINHWSVTEDNEEGEIK